MPAYGYKRTVIDRRSGLLELREITFALGPDGLRRVAAFLSHYADRIKAGDWHSDHFHIGAYDRLWYRDHPDLDLIVGQFGTTDT